MTDKIDLADDEELCLFCNGTKKSVFGGVCSWCRGKGKVKKIKGEGK